MGMFPEAVNQWINTSQAVTSEAVIPAKAGIQYLPLISVKTIGKTSRTPAFAEVTEIMIFHRLSGRVISGHVYALFKAGYTRDCAARI